LFGQIFGGLVDGMTWLINTFYGFTVSLGIPNYGLAFIVLTVTIKIVLHPLTRKQAMSVKGMQKIQPKIKELEQKYKKKDPQLMQQKMMELYREHNINPLAGCLPILIQMPILIALYRAIITFKPINQEHYNFLFVDNLGVPDSTYVFPVLAVASTFLLSKMTTPTGTGAEGMQKTMMYIMPLFIGWISLKFPVALVLYWIVYNLAGAAEQYIVNKTAENNESEGIGEKEKPAPDRRQKGVKGSAGYRKNR